MIEEFGKEKGLSIINDPFSKNKITKVMVWGAENLDKTKFNFRGNVEFKNENTTGQQDFTGESFDHVVSQIKAMIENL